MAVQQDVLSQFAREKVRDEWLRRKESVLAHLRRELADGEKLEQDTRRDVEYFSRVVGATPEDAARLFEEYASLRARRTEACREALAADPPRWKAVLEEVRGLFRDEDQMVEKAFGSETRQRLRASQLEKRTVILAIAAAYAGMSWEEAVRW